MGTTKSVKSKSRRVTTRRGSRWIDNPTVRTWVTFGAIIVAGLVIYFGVTGSFASTGIPGLMTPCEKAEMFKNLYLNAHNGMKANDPFGFPPPPPIELLSSNLSNFVGAPGAIVFFSTTQNEALKKEIMEVLNNPSLVKRLDPIVVKILRSLIPRIDRLKADRSETQKFHLELYKQYKKQCDAGSPKDPNPIGGAQGPGGGPGLGL